MRVTPQLRIELTDRETEALHPCNLRSFGPKDCGYVQKLAKACLYKAIRSEIQNFEEIRLRCNDISPRMNGMMIAFEAACIPPAEETDSDILLRLMAITAEFSPETTKLD